MLGEVKTLFVCWNIIGHKNRVEHTWEPGPDGSDVCPICKTNHKVALARRQAH